MRSKQDLLMALCRYGRIPRGLARMEAAVGALRKAGLVEASLTTIRLSKNARLLVAAARQEQYEWGNS